MSWAPDAVNVAYALATLVFISSIPSIWSLVTGGWRVVKDPNRNEALYEDEDGTATPESIKGFSNKIQFTVIFVVTLVGLTLSIADFVFLTTRKLRLFDGTRSENGVILLIPAWLLLLLQLSAVSRLTEPVAKFEAVTAKLTPCFLTAGLILMTLIGDPIQITTILTSCQMGAIIVLITTIFSVKRRPELFCPDGRPVDRQRNVSLWSKYSFHWGVDVLATATTNNFENSDIPAMDHIVRAENATSRFRNIVIKENSLPLWVQIVWAFRWDLTVQWLGILFSNFFDVAPAFATLQLLRYLETRPDADANEPGAWKYVVGIVAATTSSLLVDSRLMWWVNANIQIPLRSILTGLVYVKMLKIKDSSKPPEHVQREEKDVGVKNTSKPERKQAASQQDVVNMFAVDCTQVAQFGAMNTAYVNFAGKFIVSVAFLLVLIGWESLCAGLLGIAVLFPINKYLATQYGKKQKALMGIRDKRTAVTTEALQGIRQIKFSAIETQWAEKLEAIRDEELATLWKSRVYNIYMSIGSEFTPVVLTALTLATYSWIHGNLLPSIAFTSISLFIQLEGIVANIPYLLVSAINAKISSDRIQNFLRLPEKPENTFPGDSISFHSASVSFPHDSPDSGLIEENFTLRELDIEFPNNVLSVISGPTGSGKSLLLASILGEAELLSGYIQVPKSTGERFDSKATAADWIIPSAIAFVSQTPWIENATIKDNILFGLPFDQIRYKKVIDACALTQDLAIFEDGDQTEVGAQGISLSGGQKWRLTLARAFYSRAGILIMDDVFSALDAHVGKYIYENAVMGELSEGRTRILATHHVSLCLPRAKYAVRLSAKGVLEHTGLIEDLRDAGTLDDILKADDVVDSLDVEVDNVLEANNLHATVNATFVPKAAPKKLHEAEKRQTGRVKNEVYGGYLGASGGWPFWSVLLVFYILTQGFMLGRTYWVRIWSSDYQTAKDIGVSFITYDYQSNLQRLYSGQPINHIQPISPVNSTVAATNAHLPINIHNRTLGFYLGVYCLISLISVVFSIIRLYMVYSGSIRASRKIFKDILHSVLRAPLRWLDTVPLGRILNRFTGDFTSLDSSLAQNFYYFSGAILDIIGVLVAAIFVSPFIILCAVFLLLLCTYFAKSFIAAARSVKRLESTNKSPVISHFSASLTGLSTIRSFSKSPVFVARMFELIDSYAACTWVSSMFRSWLRLRIGIMSSLFAGVVAAFVITQRGIDASLAGFALSFGLSFGYRTGWAISMSTQLELDMNAVERIFEYRDLTIEDQGGDEVRATWPENGRLEVNNLELGYAEGLPAILKGLSFTAEGNQRIGVIGRTGAGKSTLSLALFRFLNARKGSIIIDGVDISKIRLDDLRTRLGIISQDPVLFSGTIRSNLDPFSEFSDYQLREALMRVHLIPSNTHTPGLQTPLPESSTASSTTVINLSQPRENKNLFLSLNAPIASGGSNLSQGQKQLLCLARAILSRPKVLLLDEATSAVDMETDILIQRSIREEFSNTTLLVIAHRLSTVADFDKILVMKDGVNAEFGSPKELLEKEGEGALFKDMVGQSGEKEELERIILEGAQDWSNI